MKLAFRPDGRWLAFAFECTARVWDPATGKFYLKDLSRLGTTIDGQKAPSSIEYAGGEKRDKNLEVELPASAEICLADVVTLQFQAK